MKPKIRVAVIFGGTNTEHEVSLVSAKGIIDNLDKTKYDVVPIKITKENTWISPKELQASYAPAIPGQIASAEQSIDSVSGVMENSRVDVVFPVLHGPYGEDGTIQGMLELMRLPYVGCNVLASAICMDKVVQKQLAQSVGIPVPPYSWFTHYDWQKKQDVVIKEAEGLGYPLFVKPANQGSSIGVTKAHDRKELLQGIKDALTRDTKIIIEAGIQEAREIECAVLGNSEPQSSVLGEIIPGNEFYDYEAKYLDDKSQAIIPAKLESKLSDDIRAAAIEAFKVLNCSGLARVDFLLSGQTGKWYLNELNTLPGFTPISMYPKLWEATGVSYSELLDRLIQLAIEKQQEKATLNLSR
jgi:D-alanine-D-alanine ligase